MTLVADKFEHVVGIDTHSRTHTYCLVHALTGAAVDTAVFPTSAAGNARAVSWIARRSHGTTVLAAVEGTSSYGASITTQLIEAGINVVEVRPESRSSHAHTGKSDALDAEAAARAVLGRDLARLPQPRSAGERTALRVLLTARSLIDQQRTATRNALNALVRSVDLGVDARRPLTDTQIKTIAAWRTSRDAGAVRIARKEAKRLAGLILGQTQQLDANHHELAALQKSSRLGCKTSAESDRSPEPYSSPRTLTTDAFDQKQRSRRSAGSPRSRHHLETAPATYSPDPVTGNSIAPSTSSFARA